VQHDPVVDGQRVGGRVAPTRPRRAAFEKRKAIRVEEFAAVGRQPHGLVLDAAVHPAKRRQQATPNIRAPGERFLAMLIRALAQSLAQGGDGVALIVEFVAEGQQLALLRREQKHEPHHHGQRGLVELRDAHAHEQRAVALPVEAV